MRSRSKQDKKLRQGEETLLTSAQREGMRDPLEILEDRYSGMSLRDIRKRSEMDADVIARRSCERLIRKNLRKRKH